MNPFYGFLIFTLAILGFVAFSLSVNALLAPSKKKINAANTEPFECGAKILQEGSSFQIPISYYQIAIMFVLFDLEGIFLFLWAMAAPPMSHFLMGTFVLFMTIMILMFVYIWREGILDFLKRRPEMKEEL